MPVIKFKKEWRDYKPGNIVDTLNDRICEELIAAEFADRYESEEKDKRAIKTSLGYKYAILKSTDLIIEFHEKETKRLKEKRTFILKEIAEAEKSLDESEEKEIDETEESPEEVESLDEEVKKKNRLNRKEKNKEE